MEAHANFHAIYLWRLQLIETMETSTSADSGNFQTVPWKLPLTSMDMYLLPPTSMQTSMEGNLLAPTSMKLGSRWTQIERKTVDPYEHVVEAAGSCDTRGSSRYKYFGVLNGNSWKPSTDYVRGSCK